MSDKENIDTAGIGELITKIAEEIKDAEIGSEIQYPIEVSNVCNYSNRIRPGFIEAGTWVSVRPCAEDCKDKTFLGIYLGDMLLECHVIYYRKDKELKIVPHSNPAIWIPDLNRIVWGCGSWWGVIKSPDDLKKITDADIQNIWYVKALKELSSEAAKKEASDKR